MHIKVHPLVVMSVADHYTRDNIQVKKDRVIGTLFGTQTGREVDILESFEIAWKLDADGGVQIEQQAFEDDQKLFKSAYPTYECLGWYSTGDKPRPKDIDMHQLMTKYNERPLYLMLDPKAKGDRELPVSVYIEEVHVDKGNTTNALVKTKFEIQADEAERITAVHCAKVVTGGDQTGSVLLPHFSTLSKAIGQLNSRVSVLHKFLSDIQSGKQKPDQKILREIKGLCHRLPTMDSAQFTDDFLGEYNDALLVTYLSSLTKGTQMIGDVVEKFNTTFGGRGRGGMGGGMMMDPRMMDPRMMGMSGMMM
jgi:COP9 signalosome complex subunit 6